MSAIAFDANAIHAFQDERISGEPALGHAAVDRCFAEGCIALDLDGQCLQEWLDTAAGKVPFALSDWISNELVMGRIRYFPLGRVDRRELFKLGLPAKDHKWVRLAVGSEGKTIVTNDVDFFDPALKGASSSKKQKVRENGGKCSKALNKDYGIDVRCMLKFANGI